LQDPNPYPGRMARNAAVAFILSGLCFILISYARKRILAYVIQIMIFGILLLGFSAALGHILNLEFLYSWYRYSQMAIPTLVCVIILGSGLWSALAQIEREQDLYKGAEDKKILLISGFILSCIAFISGFTSFAIFMKYNEISLQLFQANNITIDANTAILNAATRDELRQVIPLFILIIASGLLLLYWHIAPLIRHVIESEDKAKINQKRLEKNQAHLKKMAYRDTLTHLVNRAQLEFSMNEILATARRYHHVVAVLFLDLDHFKKVNDTLGHDAGDLLLTTVAKRLTSSIRANDVVARLGGDEFVIVLVDVHNVETVAMIAEKIINILNKPMMIKGHEIIVGTSIGIGMYPNDGDDYQTLTKNADSALYQAKEKGRNNYQFCTAEASAQVQEKKHFENALQHALINQEFQLHYQPKFNVETNKVIGLEALLRWQSSEYGIVPPYKIIPLAEETGLIAPLSDWVLETACKQAKVWLSHGLSEFCIAVNVSARQFKHHGFVDSIFKILQENQLSAHFLELEINENLAMQDPDYSIQIFNQLKSQGVSIAIDDFGTSFSSLNCLHCFAIDSIKIDQTFIQRINVELDYHAVIRAMIHMAEALGIRVIAEGVESQAQYDFLRQAGCNEMQGYYFSKPKPASEITQMLFETHEVLA
jgi:diguanylate cyclase (GGDEF)-like protein